MPCRNRQIAITAFVALLMGLPQTPAATGATDEFKQFVEALGKNATDRSYELGTEVTLVLAPDQAVRLACDDNAEGLKSILIAWQAKSPTSWQNMDNFYAYAFWADGSSSGGGWPLNQHEGSKYRLTGRASMCAMLVKWSLKQDKLEVIFRAGTSESLIKKVNTMASPPLTANERVECFIRVWSAVKENFVFFERMPDLDWDKALTEYLPKVQQEQTNYEFYRLVTRCVALLHDGHTNFMGPCAPPQIPASPPVDVACVEGKAIVVDLADTAELRQAGIKRGTEITEVDGRSVRDLLESDIYPYIYSSTAQWRDLQALPRLLEGPTGTVASAKVRELDGSSRIIKLTRSRQGVKEWNRTEWARRSPRSAGIVADGIFYMPLDSFGGKDVVDKFVGFFDQIAKSKALILDLRSNEGGNSAYGDAIVSYLTNEPLEGTRWKTRQYRPAFAAWGQKEQWHCGERQFIQPAKDRKPFLGAVVVLVGPRTFSAGEDFLIPLHASHRATLVGMPTGGSTGQPLLVALPGGASMRICTKWDTYPDGREFVGVGVIPDVKVEPTRAEVAAGKYADSDPVFEKALEILRRQAPK